jgi:hypothetical protein
MSDAVADYTMRMLREIHNALADMRDDHTVTISILNRCDESMHGLTAETRALRSQFDRFRNEMRERLQRIEELLVANRGAK